MAYNYARNMFSNPGSLSYLLSYIPWSRLSMAVPMRRYEEPWVYMLYLGGVYVEIEWYGWEDCGASWDVEGGFNEQEVKPFN